jgi:anti-sigma factor RsiW
MSHPTEELLEATVRGSLPAGEAQVIRSHVASCRGCRSILEQDQDVRGRLALLSDGTPRMDVTDYVMSRLEKAEPPRTWRRWVACVGLALTVLVAGVLVVSNGNLRRTVRRLGSVALL